MNTNVYLTQAEIDLSGLESRTVIYSAETITYLLNKIRQNYRSGGKAPDEKRLRAACEIACTHSVHAKMQNLRYGNVRNIPSEISNLEKDIRALYLKLYHEISPRLDQEIKAAIRSAHHVSAKYFLNELKERTEPLPENTLEVIVARIREQFVLAGGLNSFYKGQIEAVIDHVKGLEKKNYKEVSGGIAASASAPVAARETTRRVTGPSLYALTAAAYSRRPDETHGAALGRAALKAKFMKRYL